jgi:mRNA interferase MazF
MGGLLATRGKVVLLPFPFDDLSATKVRPAVCLTDPIGPDEHVILAFITSRVPEVLLDTDIMLSMERSGYAETGLRVPSVLRLHRLMTVATSLIRRELGVLSPEMQTEIDPILRGLFDLK